MKTTNFLRSLNETSQVVKSLTTTDIKVFPNDLLALIKNNYTALDCKVHFHPGLTCNQYAS